MTKFIDKVKRWITEEMPEEEPPVNAFDRGVKSALKWAIHNLCPILLIALVIDVTIIFTVPVEVTMLKWYWLKSPIAISLAYLLFRIKNLKVWQRTPQ